MHKFWSKATPYLKSFLRWVLCSVAVGAAAGTIGSVFCILINQSSQFFTEHNWLVWLLPVGGICIVLLYRWCKKSHDNGTDTVIFSVRRTDRIPSVMVPLIFISTLLTRAFGGSVGTEGAAIQLGGGLASTLGRLFRMTAKEKKIMIMCGISAGFAAVVGTPVTAIVLALELAGIGVVFYSALLPCALSSVTGFLIASAFRIDFPRYMLEGIPALGPISIIQVVILAALCGLVSILFCVALRKSKQFYEHVFPGKMPRIIAGGLIIVGLTYLAGNNLYNGDSIGLIGAAVNGTSAPQDFLWKIVFTALTIGAGYKGGEIVPTFVIGATFGGFAGNLLGLSPSMGAGIGLVSVFCGAVNCPLTAFVLGLEVFGSGAGLFFLLACAVSYVFSGYYGIYPSQKIWFDKLRAVFVGRNAE
ncbi:chloride channel protein [Christensenella intestinihominis]|uniref:chloride channel protein n=1 Tax=Christensenella intestinihominis TaxID=1851429 RepID=UPI00082D08C5|nr:chloride channel protein [Christensenella intestinihominis]